MLADGGDCLADLGAVRDQARLFGEVASDSTAFRVIDRIAVDPGAAGRAARRACACARARLDAQRARRERLTIDLDATLISSHSEKEGAAGTFKGGYGFHPMLAYATRPARRWPRAAARQRGREHRRRSDRGRRAGARADPAPSTSRASSSCCAPTRAGASHELLDWCREAPDPLLGRL